MKYQKGTITAFKLVNSDHKSPIQTNGKIKYEVGHIIKLKKDKCNFDEFENCGAGINLGTLKWCIENFKEHAGGKILLVEHTAKDIVAIPYTGFGKYRVKKCRVIKEMDLEGLGLK